MSTVNIAIDGPAGAGKSTIAKLAAEKLGFLYVDTGAMYRAMALKCIRNGVASSEEDKVSDICSGCDIDIKYENGEQNVLLDGENVNSLIRTEEVSQMTSAISVYQKVREKLLLLQRNVAKNNNVIMDGRDIGSNVLKDADVKIYLTASVQTRAKRRYAEQKEKGMDVSLADIEKDIEERDYRDMHREIAPLVVAENATIIDSSDMTIEQVTDKIVNLANNVK